MTHDTPHTGARFDGAAYDRLKEMVIQATGLAFLRRNDHLLRHALDQRVAGSGDADPADYMARTATRDPDELDALIGTVAVGETYFFRHPDQFDFIRGALRGLGTRPAAPRIWSAGCSSGEEAYSLAVLLEEEGLARRGAILATDISERALAKARRGVYTRWSLRGVDDAVVERYFDRADGKFTIAPRLRSQITFERMNLMADAGEKSKIAPRAMDLILCRNVLIYFTADTAARVTERLLAALAPGGWLVTGPSDPLIAPKPPFRRVATQHGSFYQRAPDVWATPAPAVSAPPPDPAAFGTAPSGWPETAAEPMPAPVAPAPPPDAFRFDEIQALLGAGDLIGAERSARTDAADGRGSTELHFLHGVILMALRRDRDAVTAFRRALYADRALAAVHLAMGVALRRAGIADAALKSFRNAYELLQGQAEDAAVPLSEGSTAGVLAVAAARQIDELRQGDQT